MTLNELKKIVDLRIQLGGGDLQVVAGDCNKMHKAYDAMGIVVEDLDEHYLEEIHPNDNVDGRETNAFLIAI